MWLFMKTKAGVIMRCSGGNPGFSRTLGINNNKIRTIGIVASTVIAAIGINIYSQSYGFYQSISASDDGIPGYGCYINRRSDAEEGNCV